MWTRLNTHIFAQNGNYQHIEITPTDNMEGGGRGSEGGRGKREGGGRGNEGVSRAAGVIERRGGGRGGGGEGKGHQFSYYSLTKSMYNFPVNTG